VDIGRLTTIGPSDDLTSLAKRYGTSVESIYDLNFDLKILAMESETYASH
jgi:hypothetical protein